MIQNRVKNMKISIFFLVSLLFQYLVVSKLLSLYDRVRLARYRQAIHELKNVSQMKFILFWELSDINRRIFQDFNCNDDECVFSHDKGLIGGDYRNFDAVVFDEEALLSDISPKYRRPSQLYIFSSTTPYYEVPACGYFSEYFYNWTFTYRLDSDVPSPYFTVKDLTGQVVAPKINAAFDINLNPVSQRVKAILARKSKAAAWVIDDCQMIEARDQYFLELRSNMSLHALNLDIFGKCSQRSCREGCNRLIKDQYFFYLAFEGSYAEDHVTGQVLNGYNNYAVPVVYGGADYSRFLPPKSYIDARDISPLQLTLLMKHLMSNRTQLIQYFQWTNSYTFHTQPHPLCELCTALRSDRAADAPPRPDFRDWWNGDDGMIKFCLQDLDLE